jgi:hypothetical protein
MLLRNPETPVSRFEVRKKPSEPTEYELKYAALYGFAQRSLSRVALLATGITLAGVPTYWVNVMQNTITEEQAKPSINVMAGPLHEEDKHKATIILNGFNTLNADGYTESMGKSIQQYADGELWSVDYNNAPLNGKTIYESAYELAVKRGITSLSVASYSMGDVPAVEVAADFVAHSPIPVEKIAITSGPSNYSGLRESMQKQLESAKFWSQWPGLTHSTYGRYAAELYFYKDFYSGDGFDLEKFWDTATSIAGRFNENELTSNSFLMSQIEALDNANIEGNFKKIAEKSKANSTLTPVVMYFGTGKAIKTKDGLQGGYDYIVNDKLSSQEICQYAAEADMPCFTYYVPGAEHSRYYESTKQYMDMSKVAAKVVNPYQEARAEEFHNSLLNSTYADSLEPGDLTLRQ